MKLQECLNIATECGLYTLGEAYNNIKSHSLGLFDFSEASQELQELRDEITEVLENKKFNLRSSTVEIIRYLRKKKK